MRTRAAIKIFLIFFLLLQGFHVVDASTYYVRKSNSQELLHRLSHVKNGDMLILMGGLYNGHFHIDKSITLTSNSKSTLTSKSTGSILDINASDVTIKNLTFSNSGNSLNRHDSCIVLRNNHFKWFQFA